MQPANHLILGDNLAVMSACCPNTRAVDLIYADPPFFSPTGITRRASGRGEDSRSPQEWQLAEGYPDHWASLDAYLDMLYPRLALMHRLLAPTGTLYLHLDWHARRLCPPAARRNLWRRPPAQRDHLGLPRPLAHPHRLQPQARYHPGLHQERELHLQCRCRAPALRSGNGQDLCLLSQGRLRKSPRTWNAAKCPKTGGISRWWRACTTSAPAIPPRSPRPCWSASSWPRRTRATWWQISSADREPLAVAARLGRRFIGSDIAWRAFQTTRARLVRQSSVPFTVLVEQAQMETWEQAAGSTAAGLKLIVEDNTARLDGEGLDLVDYWEVDPAWDGQDLRSAAQAVTAVARRFNPDASGYTR